MIKKGKRLFILCVIFAMVFSLASCGDESADIVITNANIYTADEKGTVAEAVAVKDGEIIYVGDNKGAKELTGSKTEKIDGGGGTLMPGIVDSHMHPARSAVSYMYEMNLVEAFSKEEYLDVIKAFVKENPDMKVYAGTGYMRSAFDEVGPRAVDLDKICADKPILITSVDGHSMWVNTKALEEAGITENTKNPEGGIIQRDPKTGEPSGLLQESAMGLVADQAPKYTKEQYKEAVVWLQKWFNEEGLTTIYDAMIPLDDQNYYMAYEELAKEGKLTLRIRGAWHMYPEMGDMTKYEASIDKGIKLSETFKTDYFQVNSFKFFADQVIEEETGYLSRPYSNRDDQWHGLKVWDDEVLADLFTKIDKAGFQIHVHQIGDAAAAYALDAIGKAVSDNGERDSRHTFAHVQMLSDKDKKRMADFKMNAVIAPYWMAADDYYLELYLPYLGKERAEAMYPAKSLVDAGINTAIHSDFFVTEPDTGWLFYGAMTRNIPQKIFDLWYEGTAMKRTDSSDKVGQGTVGPLKPDKERMSLEEIMKASTYGGAYANFMEEEIGSIEKGKKADIILYEKNLFDLDAEGVSGQKPILTIFDGKIVFDRDKK